MHLLLLLDNMVVFWYVFLTTGALGLSYNTAVQLKKHGQEQGHLESDYLLVLHMGPKNLLWDTSQSSHDHSLI